MGKTLKMEGARSQRCTDPPEPAEETALPAVNHESPAFALNSSVCAFAAQEGDYPAGIPQRNGAHIAYFLACPSQEHEAAAAPILDDLYLSQSR